MNELSTTTEDIEPRGMADVDYSIQCNNCNKLLRNIDGTDVFDIFDDQDGQDICYECYQMFVEPFIVWDNNENYIIGYKESGL